MYVASLPAIKTDTSLENSAQRIRVCTSEIHSWGSNRPFQSIRTPSVPPALVLLVPFP